MNQKTPRLRIFAGPNGSGKSTIKEVISEELLGIYINPDYAIGKFQSKQTYYKI